jgi:hypothetical protein
MGTSVGNRLHRNTATLYRLYQHTQTIRHTVQAVPTYTDYQTHCTGHTNIHKLSDTLYRPHQYAQSDTLYRLYQYTQTVRHTVQATPIYTDYQTHCTGHTNIHRLSDTLYRLYQHMQSVGTYKHYNLCC